MSTKKDKFSLKEKNYMRLALNLAMARKGLTGENPPVGCVITKNDKIISIGDLKNQEAKTIVDAEGLCVSPGFIDTHSHADFDILRDPFGEDFENNELLESGYMENGRWIKRSSPENTRFLPRMNYGTKKKRRSKNIISKYL